jgi:hypothetical protein
MVFYLFFIFYVSGKSGRSSQLSRTFKSLLAADGKFLLPGTVAPDDTLTNVSCRETWTKQG